MKNKISFNELEEAQKFEIEVQAELNKQKEIIKHELELDNKRHMDAIMNNISKSQMYNLEGENNVQNIQRNQNVQPTQNVRHDGCQMHNIYREEKENFRMSIAKGKEKIMMILLVMIIVLLAIGVTPSGAWYEALQTSYVETLVDIFKVGMIGFGGWLTYKLFKR